MAIKNLAFSIYQNDDDSVSREMIDRRVNVERHVLELLSHEDPYPQTGDIFSLKNDLDMNCTVVTVKDEKKILWRSPSGPCINGSNEMYNWLCDGKIPTCSKFIRGNGEYAPTGCKHWHKCSKSWNRKIIF
ncbi:hypothetical protein [Desulfocucumis palustris]|uniref:hypothetical protein n=1 Tax=Desulfocucumis palustris TaxID=1898651 RepID=UPI000CEA4FD0|nr:hypothetical protein [Desulfocucumis palustris]